MERVPHYRRIYAYLIDITICFLFAFYVNKFFDIKLETRYFKYFELLFIFAQIILFIYLFLSYMFFNGTSIGKRILGTRIVMDDNRNMSLFTIFIRSLMQSMLIMTIVNALYQLYNKSFNSLFDIATNTHSIFIKNEKK